MVYISHVILEDHVIKESSDFKGKSPLRQVNPGKFGGHKYCGRGYIFLGVEGQDSTCSLSFAITVYF